MKEKGFLFSGGGCSDVCVGGLVQGGGWGPYSRRLGLTCDRLVGFTMVKANGEVVTAGEDENHDLLWAVRGGGGGNFGVITQFVFDLAPRFSEVQTFTLIWDHLDSAVPVLREWWKNFPQTDDRLTTFCRISVFGPDRSLTDGPVLVGGNFLGDWSDLTGLLKYRLLPTTWGRAHYAALSRPGDLHPDYQPGPPVPALRALHPGVPDENLSDTCAGIPLRHKVSSSFPKGSIASPVDERAIAAIVEKIRKTTWDPRARLYLSLHGMGGAITRHDAQFSAFAFRNKPHIFQYQAWWAGADPALEASCCRWISEFRKTMAPYTENAFINFPDASLATDRKELLSYYYGGNLGKLIEVKRQVDPDDLLNFGMGIPPR